MIVSLFGIAEEFWPTITARYYQIDLLEIPLTKFLDLIFAWCRELIPDQQEWEQVLMRIEPPVLGNKEKVSETTADAEGQAFMTVMQMTGGG